MIGSIQDRMDPYIEKSFAKIIEMLAAINAALERIRAEHEAEAQSLGSLECEDLNDDPESSAARIRLLENLIHELVDERRHLSILLSKLVELSVLSGGDILGKTASELSGQADCLEEIARVLPFAVDKSCSYVRNAFGDETSPEIAKILVAVAEYKKAATELVNACQETSYYLRLMKDRIAPPPKIDSVQFSAAASYVCAQRKAVEIGDRVVPPPQIDSVQFSAVAPHKAVPGRYIPISVVMYEDAYREIVDEIARSHEGNTKESKSGYHDVERNAWIKVVLTSDDVTVKDGVEEQKWSGKYLNFEFAVKIPGDFAEDQILLSATVYVNDIIATKLKLILDCGRKPKRNISVTREDIVSAFVSYASQDRNRVASIIQGMQKARPDMDIFFDIENLRSGQKWEEVLKKEIESRDILFLCWSRHARDSRWVDMEWRYALESKGEDCIEPIPIDPPDICPPPAELQQKHFNDKMLLIIKATMPVPHLIRVKTGECMAIDKPNVCIGKGPERVDLMISGNVAISRRHACIISRYGQYYIVDLLSTNHTYVDGREIPSSIETLIGDGTRIRLANEEFEFIC